MVFQEDPQVLDLTGVRCLPLSCSWPLSLPMPMGPLPPTPSSQGSLCTLELLCEFSRKGMERK